MNCPQCQQPIGQDQHWISPWRELLDSSGEIVVAGERTIYIHCDHCGTFTVLQSIERGQLRVCRIRKIRARRRIEAIHKKLPALQLERVPA